MNKEQPKLHCPVCNSDICKSLGTTGECLVCSHVGPLDGFLADNEDNEDE